MKPPPPNDQTHFVCERCGGTGQQEAGLWNPDTRKYDDPAGTCRACQGSGYLGPLPPRTPLISQSDLADVLIHEGIIDYDAVERPEDYDGGTTELQVSIAARELDRIARENAKNEAVKQPSGIEAAVCREIAARQIKGIAKYGQQLADNHAPLSERLQHAKEEAMDGACYLEWARLEAVRLETGAAKLAAALAGLLDLIGAGDAHMTEAVNAHAALAAWKEANP